MFEVVRRIGSVIRIQRKDHDKEGMWDGALYMDIPDWEEFRDFVNQFDIARVRLQRTQELQAEIESLQKQKDGLSTTVL